MQQQQDDNYKTPTHIYLCTIYYQTLAATALQHERFRRTHSFSVFLIKCDKKFNLTFFIRFVCEFILLSLKQKIKQKYTFQF